MSNSPGVHPIHCAETNSIIPITVQKLSIANSTLLYYNFRWTI